MERPLRHEGEFFFFLTFQPAYRYTITPNTMRAMPAWREVMETVASPTVMPHIGRFIAISRKIDTASTESKIGRAHV